MSAFGGKAGIDYCAPSASCAGDRREERFYLLLRIGRPHHATHHRDAGRTYRKHLSRTRYIEAANSEDGDMRRSSDLRKPFAANLGTIARFARSLERRSRDRIIENARIDRLGFGDGVDRHADELVGS